MDEDSFNTDIDRYVLQPGLQCTASAASRRDRELKAAQSAVALEDIAAI